MAALAPGPLASRAWPGAASAEIDVVRYHSEPERIAYVAALAEHSGLAFVPEPRRLGLSTKSEPTNLRDGWASGQINGEPWVVLDGTLGAPQSVSAIARRLQERGYAVGLAPPVALRECVLASAGPAILRQATSGLARSDPAASARSGSWVWQASALAAGIGTIIGLIFIAGISAQWLLTVLLTLPFLAVVLLRAAVLLAYPWARPRTRALRRMRQHDRELPVYTLLVPLYKEARMLPGLIRALRALDYPAAKLDIKLILESVDAETLAAARKLKLRPPFELIIVPDREPRSKPKALNYAMAFAKGDFVGVFDAEDVPDAGQLRKALTAFADGPDNLGCVQGRLVIDNPRDGWMCRQFALEYLTLFDGLLPALDRFGLPLPLGGTSNHFPIRVLHEAGAWDAWNMTEDADLGLRLARNGYCSRVIATNTCEEAPNRFGSWFRQRTRWMKGWMQTYIVHSRRPWQQLRQLGPWGWFGFQAVFGGGILSCLLYPWSIAVLAVQVLFNPAAGHAEASGDLFLNQLALYSLSAGLGVALGHSFVCALGKGRWRLLFDVPFMPFYWLLVSLATYRAIIQLAREPFKWEKTEHGLSKRRRRRPSSGTVSAFDKRTATSTAAKQPLPR